MKYSVIVPVYNCEKYIEECIYSVLQQDVKSYEIIVVNDGSTDNSFSIASSLALEYKEIRVIHTENRGQFFARRLGIDNAEGDYIIFLDSDDYWEKNTLNIIDNYIKEDVDILIFSGRTVGNCKSNIIGKYSNNIESIDVDLFRRILIKDSSLNSACLKVYKKELFQGDENDYSSLIGIGYCEDKVLNLWPATNSKHIITLPNVLYNYRKHNESVMNSITIDRVSQNIANNVFAIIYEYMKCWGMDNEKYIRLLVSQYLNNFTETFYKVLRSCKNEDDIALIKRFEWKKVLNRKSKKYIFICKMNLRKKIKIFSAVYCRGLLIIIQKMFIKYGVSR